MATGFPVLQDLKDYMLVVGNDRNAMLTSILNGVNARIPSRTGRDWTQDVRVEQYRGAGTNSIVLRNYPVLSVASLKYGTGANVEVWDPKDTTQVWCSQSDGVLWRADGLLFERSVIPNIQITYIGGPDEVPDELFMASLEICQWIVQSSGGRSNVSSNGTSVALFQQALEFLPSVVEALDEYSDVARGYLRN